MKAWQLIEKFGWCQGAMVRDKQGKSLFLLGDIHGISEEKIGGLCILGACHKAHVGKQAFRKVEKLRELIGRAPEDWNDDPNRTKDEVIALLKEADV